MRISDINIDKLTPMMRQYVDIKKDYEDTILFFRLGDFYEMFFEDGLLASRELEIALTGKNAGLSERIPMCGVPYHSAAVYIEKLLEKGYKVAICEQVEEASQTKGLVKREVVQVITPGTIMNMESLDEKENNYIATIHDANHAFVLSYSDLSTGEIYSTLIEHDEKKLITELLSINAKEVVVSSNFLKNIVSILKDQFHISLSFMDEVSVHKEYKYIYEDIKDVRHVQSITRLIAYLINTQKRSLQHLQAVKVIKGEKYLKMDIYSKINLELTETIRNKTRHGSLLWLLDKTKTAMGGRMLKQWINKPLVDIDQINERLNMVRTLQEQFILRDELKNLLTDVYDLERLSARVAFGNVNARDLNQLNRSLKQLPDIKRILGELKYKETIETCDELFNLLDSSIVANPSISIKEGGIIKDGYNGLLDQLKDARKNGKDWIARLEQSERERTGIKSLKVGYNKVFGYYIEVTKANVHLILDEYGYDRKQTLSNSERYITPELKEKESIILGAEEKIVKLEYELFIDIRQQVKQYIPILQRVSRVISEIDVLQSFSYVSEENRYSYPILSKERNINIKNGWHPVVVKSMKEEFVPNDIIMEDDTDILLITGPNMSGKSTYMRQMTLISIMAQIGCFVPCDHAELPVFDQIFTRIGASDDLISGQSTFMVEMIEANNAISSATENSLIIFDEIGRGTATYDGMSLAQAIIEYIHDKIHAKTIFSTHYHELTHLEEKLDKLKNISVLVKDEKGKVVFLHKIGEGAADKSYGIHVAKLAKLPNSLIKRAETILSSYEFDNKVNESMQLEFVLPTETKEEELDLIGLIDEIDPLSITPLEALNKLYEIKEKIKMK